MKKYFSLILKDFIIMKWYMIFTAVIIVVIPLLFLPILSLKSGISGFTVAYIFALYSTSQSLSYYEAKYNKAEALLNSSPYSKRAIVISRYVFLLLIYAITIVVYTVMSLIIPKLEPVSATEAVVALLIGSLLVGILQPLTYKFGIVKTRYINIVVMLGVAIGFPYLVSALANGNITFDFLNLIHPAVIYTAAILLSAIILSGSASISIKVYKNKEF